MRNISDAIRLNKFLMNPRIPKVIGNIINFFLGRYSIYHNLIFSRRWRRIIFIPTTWGKFINAVEINDLYNESPLEERLWAEFKHLQIQAERQELVTVKNQNYFWERALLE